MIDRHGRPLDDLRISVTDRCNFRCTYCMPLERYDWIERSEILSFEEIRRVAAVFAQLGVRKVRVTGGEPLLRVDLESLVRMLAEIEGIEDTCLTTNGSLLAPKAEVLKRAGLRRVTVSLDSLRPETFSRMAQRGSLENVLDGIDAALSASLLPLKLNVVVERGVNDTEILDLLEFGRQRGIVVRFIEYMDVGTVNQWSSSKLVSKAEILRRIRQAHPFEPDGHPRGSAPAQRFRLSDGSGVFGVIASVTEPFCGACTRARLTADGRLVTCLFSAQGHDLKRLLRSGGTDEQLRRRIAAIWRSRSDRYSEQRLEAISSGSGYSPLAVQKIEMISLGG